MNNSVSYEDKLIDAIQAVVDSAVSNAGYDKTIQAKIITCVDPTIGKYKVQYQDSTFYAYSGSSDVIFTDNSDVYVLVPGNDMSRDKTILGTTKKLGADYAVIPEGEEMFEPVGNNCIDSKEIFELCSYKTVPELVIYDKDSEDNKIRLNLKSVESYIKRSSSIVCAANIKTSLPAEQQFRGNYGIVFELAFKDNATQEIVIRNYLLDINQIEGNPYNIPNYRRQVGIFDIDAVNFQYVNRIYLFDYNFPNQAEDKNADIFIKDIEFCGAVATSADELNSCGITILTPQGAYFDDNDEPSSTRKLQAQVKVKGKAIDNNSQQLSFYWFVENVTVTSSSDKYNVYGGQGWECLNPKNIIQDGVVEWSPDTYIKLIRKDISEARETKYKCVALYNNLVLSKEVIITNYSSNYNITIESDDGTQFYHDIGIPTLTCLINGNAEVGDEYSYSWGEIDNAGHFTTLAETTAENDEYNQKRKEYNQLLEDIKNENKLLAAEQENINSYLTYFKNYDKITRVEKNVLHKVLISSIVNFKTFKCSVFKNGKFIGTSSIILYNDLENENDYSLVINNGEQIFKYNEAGIAPTSKTLSNPMTLLPLTFTIYDNLGRPIEDDVARHCDIQWIVPTKETMLQIPSSQGKADTVDLINNTETYKNVLQLNYAIGNKYILSNNKNTIKLVVNYQNIILTAETDFTFTKEGEPGTNGTDLYCRIVPNTDDGNFDEYPMILNGELNYKPRKDSQWFEVELWEDGDKIFNGTSTGHLNSDPMKNAVVVWSILKNKYNSTVSDNSDIIVTDAANGLFSYTTYEEESGPANIVKASITYDDLTYYATLPIITAETIGDYKVSLIKNSGFLFATYGADGRRPEYSNSTPFELKVTNVINGVEEDVSKLEGINGVDYEWFVRGKIYNPDTKEWDVNLNLLDNSKSLLTQLERNQALYKPIDTFNGECLNNALECIIKDKSGNKVALIHIPIHLLLNKYANAAINNWDGNNVSIDENGSGVILAPQMGAGIKEDDNSFTGMFMGEVKEAEQSVSDIGLSGYNHGKRTLHLSSFDGSAILGKQGNGQIIIDPTNNQGMIYSNNFWKSYYDDNIKDSNGKITHRNGLPKTNYIYNEKTHKYDGQKNTKTDDMQNENAGMLIDLTTPRILFGTGNFRVDPNGFVYAKGGGEIAGWYIDDYKIHATDAGSPDKLGKTGMSSVYDLTAAGVTKADVKLASEGNDVGWISDSKALAFWAGKENFFVTHDGYMKVNEATIGSGTNPIFIGKSGNESVIYSGKKNSIDKATNGFYIGTNGISLGNDRFKVTNAGTLTARNGTIGGWNIDRTYLKSTNNRVTLSNNGNMNCVVDGAEKWYIHHDGSSKFGNLTISSNGYINASGGTFENITVTGSANIPASTVKGVLATDNIPNLSAGKITTGTMSANRISGGTLNISTGGGGYVKAGVNTTHLDVSGINVGSAGANFGGKGISLQNGTSWNFSGGDGNFGDGNLYCQDLVASGNLKVAGQWGQSLSEQQIVSSISEVFFNVTQGVKITYNYRKLTFTNGILTAMTNTGSITKQ